MANFVAVQQDVTERKASEAAFQLRDHALSNLSEVGAVSARMHCFRHVLENGMKLSRRSLLCCCG